MVFKRVGGMLIGSTNFDMQLITRLLVEVGYSKSNVTNWFGEGEDDAQNVPAMTKLLKAVASLGKKAASDFSEERCRSLNFETLLSDMRILAMICEKAFNVITMQDPHVDARGEDRSALRRKGCHRQGFAGRLLEVRPAPPHAHVQPVYMRRSPFRNALLH